MDSDGGDSDDGSRESLPVTGDFRELFLCDTPLLDVRAPVEFVRGAFANAENAPLLDDVEREQVGITYKEAGKNAAIELGHQLISGERKTERVERFADFAARHPNGLLYCFRGGLRSQIAQRWLYEATGVRIARVEGGYKAMRHFLITQTEHAAAKLQPLIIGGRTGVGKTLLLRELPRGLDLEALANHRGSAFGKHVSAQPSQINFENLLAVALLKLRSSGDERVVVEDESRNVGSVSIPDALHNCFKSSPLLVLEASLEERIDITFREYVIDALAEYERDQNGAASERNDDKDRDPMVQQQRAFDHWSQALLHNLQRIRRRLGPQKYERIHSQMVCAIEGHRHAGNSDLHRAWIETLLRDYYDPMYDYQLRNKTAGVEFAGPKDEIVQYIREHLQGAI